MKRPDLINKYLTSKADFINQLNDDIKSLNIRDVEDDIISKCYEHWLTSGERSCELNPTVIDNKLSLGPNDKPMLSLNSVAGTQVDGSWKRHGLFWIDKNTLVGRHNLQASRTGTKNGFDDLASVSYLIRIFNLEDGVWKIHPVGVYYQLNRLCGRKRLNCSSSDASTQTILGGEELDKILDKRGPKGPVVDKV